MNFWLCRFYVLILMLLPTVIYAQSGIIMGKIVEAETSAPVVGVTVRVMEAQDTTKMTGSSSDVRGKYIVRNLLPGNYKVSFTSIGYESHTIESVTIQSNDTVKLDVVLTPQVLNLEAVVVSASRQREKVIDAPASVSVIDFREIAETPALTPADHLRGVAGVDIAQTGIVQQNVVTRGFNNVFSGSLTMLTDNRIAAVPSLRVNVPYFIPLVNEDIERIEVVRGPGAALYGPNAHQGVVNIITRSPFASRGTSVSISGGNQSLFQSSVRHAGIITEDIGFKVSGQYFRGNDWAFTDSAEQAERDSAIARSSRDPLLSPSDLLKFKDTLKVGSRIPRVEKFGGEARLDFIFGERTTANIAVGLNQSVSGIELTDVGAAQGKDWRYTYVQGKFNYGDLFIQAILNTSEAGKTYLLRTGAPVVDRSKQFVAQVQHSLLFGDVSRLTYGADLLLTRPITDGTINGRNEESDNIDEVGGYLQSETHIVPSGLDFVAAGRIDKHNQINDPIFSPRAALVYKPWENHDLRLTFNRAYSTPTTTELFLDILAIENVFGYPPGSEVDIKASGVPKTGYSFARDFNGRPYMHSPFMNPAAAISVDQVALLWPAVVQLLAAQGVDISSIPAPTPSDIRPVMANLNPQSGSFEPVDGPSDIPALKPTITQTFEIGYKGVLSGNLEFGIDIYQSQIRNFIGAFQVVTPNVFMNRGDVTTYLSQYVSDLEAIIGGSIITQIPLGTVTPQEVKDPTDIILVPRNFGFLKVFGIDFMLEYRLNNQLTVGGSYSYVDKNYFNKLDGVEDLALNAPRKRGSFNVAYRNSNIGFNAEVRNRWIDAFPMRSGVYEGTVNSYSLVDVTLGYDIPTLRGVNLTVSGLNVFDKQHREFIGAPEIGRLMIGKILYSI